MCSFFFSYRAFLKASAIGLALYGVLPIPIANAADTVWTGATDTSWDTASNWDTGNVPTNSDRTYVDTGTVLVDGITGNVDGIYLGMTDGAVSDITITNGGGINSFNAGLSSILGHNTGSTSTALVTGAGSSWISNFNFYIGNSGDGTLTISDGAGVEDINGYIGLHSESNGSVIVTGTDSLWDNSGYVLIGSSGTASLIISDGGVVKNTYGNIAGALGSTGDVTVTGSGSTWTNSDNIYIGNYGTGTLTISDGGSVTSLWSPVGLQSGSTGMVLVTGTDSIWEVSNTLIVGRSGDGYLTISDGGEVSNPGTVVAEESGSTGTVTVTGAESLWTSSADLYIGQTGDATLTISDGGSVINEVSYIASNAGSISSVTVTGAGSAWTSNDRMHVSANGTATLNILDGAHVIASESARIGNSIGGDGTVLVSGSGSSWIITDYFHIGMGWNGAATGDLTVADGGAVSNTYAHVGNTVGSIGTVLVTGRNSSWTNRDYLCVGNNGIGTLTISEDGVVSTTATTIARWASATGTVNIGAAEGNTAVAAGVLDTPTVTFGNGTGTLVFNHIETNYDFTPDISGDGTIKALAGYTLLSGDLSGFTGSTSVSDGAYLTFGENAGTYNGDVSVSSSGVFSADNTISGTVTVNDGGTLQGSGTVGGVVINDGATLAPGNSIGTLNVAGNVAFAVGSFYDVEADSNGNSDLTHATGTATLTGGTVQMYTYPSVSESFALDTPYTILTADGGVVGTFSDITVHSPFLDGALTYDANNVYATASRNNVSFISAATTPNTNALARMLDGQMQGDALSIVASQSSYQRAQNAMEALVGDIHEDLKGAIIKGDWQFIGYATPAQDGYWASYTGDWRERGDFEEDTHGIILGKTMRLSAEDYFIVQGGAEYSDYTKSSEPEEAQAQHYRLGAGYSSPYLSVRGGYGYHRIKTKRLIDIPAYATTNHKAEYNAHNISALGMLSYPSQVQENLLFEPYTSVAYDYLYTEQFKEEGGVVRLNAKKDHFGLLEASAGVRVESDIEIMGKPANLKTDIGWRHLIGESHTDGSYCFDDSAYFETQGESLSRNALTFDAGLTVQYSPATAFGMSYGNSQSSEDSAHRAKISVHYRF